MALSENIKAYFKFDEASGDASDASGNGNTLTNVGASYASGKINNGVSFGSSWAHTNVLYKTGTGMFGLNANTGNEYSISFWFKPLATPVNDGSVGRLVDIAGAGYITLQYRNNGGTIQLDTASGSGTAITYVNTFTNNTWYYITFTCGKDNVTRLYVNGVQVGSNGTNGGSTSGSNAAIGGANNSPGSNANGCACMVDEFLVSQHQLTLDEIVALYNAGTGTAYPLDMLNGLSAYYRLNDVVDAQGGTSLTNTGTVTFAAGKVGDAADLGASNTTKWLTRTNPLTTYPLTMSAWVKPSTVNNDGNIFSLGDGTTHYYQMRFRTADSHIVFRSNNSTQAADVDTGITAVNGTWYHIVMVINSTTSVTIYVNGTATNTNATIFVASSLTQLALGALARTSPLQPMSGMLDEVGLWTRALSGAEVTTLYGAGNGLMYPLDSGIKHKIRGAYKLDESSGNAADATGRGLTLTNNNTVTYSAGKINNGADYGTSNTNKNLSRSDSLGFNTVSGIVISVSMWAYFKTAFGNSDITGLFCINALNTMQMAFNVRGNSGGTAGADMEVYFVGSSGQNNSISQTFALNTWYHLVWVLNGSTLTMYVNGVSIGSISVTYPGTTSGAASTTLGGNGLGSYMRGLIDEFYVWERTLGKEEVTALYSSGTGKQYPFPSVLQYLQSVVATVAGTPSVRTAANFLKTLAVTATSVPKVLKGLAKSLAVTVQGVPAIGKITARIRSLVATAVAVPSLAKGFVYSKVMVATAVAVPVLNKLKVRIVNLAATAVASVSISQVRYFLKSIVATAGGVVSLTKQSMLSRMMVATATAVTSIGKVKAISMQLVANVTGAVSFIKGQTLSMFMSAVARGLGSVGIDYGWVDKYPKNDTTYEDKYPPTS